MFEIEITEEALVDLSWFKKREQNIILDGIYTSLSYEPTTLTRNRKRLRNNSVAEWEQRIGDYRVLYNVEAKIRIVSIEKVGEKKGNQLFFRGEEFKL